MKVFNMSINVNLRGEGDEVGPGTRHEGRFEQSPMSYNHVYTQNEKIKWEYLYWFLNVPTACLCRSGTLRQTFSCTPACTKSPGKEEDICLNRSRYRRSLLPALNCFLTFCHAVTARPCPTW